MTVDVSTSSEIIEGLVERAFSNGPAHEANQLMAAARRAVARQEGQAVNYEVVLTDPRTGRSRGWDYLQRVVAPRLGLFLRAKQMRVGACRPCFLSVFWGEALYFIKAATFFSYFQQVAGLDAGSFAARARIWEATGQPACAQLTS